MYRIYSKLGVYPTQSQISNGIANKGYNAEPDSTDIKNSVYELEEFNGVNLSQIESSKTQIEARNLVELLSLQRQITEDQASGIRGRKKFVYPSILRALAGAAGKDFIICGIYKIFADIVTLQIPILLG